MRTTVRGIAIAGALMTLVDSATAATPPSGPLKSCPADAAVSGTVCMDRYEASVWRVPNPTTTNKGLVAKIQQGTATVAHLTAGGATQLGSSPVSDYLPCEKSRTELY